MSDTEWQRLSVREGKRAAPVLTERFSPPATRSLIYWLEGEFGYRTAGVKRDFDGLMLSVALMCDIEIDRSRTFEVSLPGQLINAVSRDDDLMLDLLDATLARGVVNDSGTLRTLLSDASSVWTVRDDGRGLIRRVAPAADQAYRTATSAADQASAELTEAWNAMYGVSPNYSDAWDHAIKAMETVLVPIVAPKNTRATLGTVTVELEKGLKSVVFALGPAEALGAITRLAWPNPDRHGGDGSRAPLEIETSAVVHLAVTVIQWVRAGVILRADELD